MCLAIVKPKGIKLSRKALFNGFDKNDDGAGFCYAEKGKMVISKGYFTFPRFYEDYAKVEHLAMLIHFRLATHGERNAANCHPFPVADGSMAMVHNGILDIQSTKELSDTGHFAKLVLDPIADKMSLDHGAIKYLVEQAIGFGNKIAVMDGYGNFIIYNEDRGEWDKGAWFSNDGYKREKWKYMGHRDVSDEHEYAGWLSGRQPLNGHSTKPDAEEADPEADAEAKRILEEDAKWEKNKLIQECMRIESVDYESAKWFVENGWPWGEEMQPEKEPETSVSIPVVTTQPNLPVQRSAAKTIDIVPATTPPPLPTEPTEPTEPIAPATPPAHAMFPDCAI